MEEKKTIDVFYDEIEQCPPSDALPISGVVYIIAKCGEVVTADCFKTMYERSSSKSKKRPYSDSENCLSRGLSCSLSLADAQKMQETVTSLHRKHILCGSVSAGDGRMLNTSEGYPCPHYTWWVDKYVEEIWLRFEIIGGPIAA